MICISTCHSFVIVDVKLLAYNFGLLGLLWRHSILVATLKFRNAFQIKCLFMVYTENP